MIFAGVTKVRIIGFLVILEFPSLGKLPFEVIRFRFLSSA